MRKMLLKMLMLMVLILGCSNRVYAIDITAPEITRVNILTSSVKKEGTIQMEMDVVETGTGISYIQVYLINIDKPEVVLLSNDTNIGYADPLYSGTTIVDISVPRTRASGEYVIYNIVIEDIVGNRSVYRNAVNGYYNNGEWIEGEYPSDDNGIFMVKCDSENGGISVDDSTVKCYMGEVTSVEILSNGDDDAVVLNSVEVLTLKIARTDSLKIKLNVTEASGIAHIQFSLIEKDNPTGFAYLKSAEGMEYDYTTGTFDKIISLNISDMYGGTYVIQNVCIEDVEGNVCTYSDIGKEFIVEAALDEVAPIVTQVTLDQTSVNAPGKLYVTVDVQDDSAITAIGLEFYTLMNGRYRSNGFINSGELEKISDGRYKVGYYITEQARTSVYYIGMITVVDVYNNASCYVNYTDISETANRTQYYQDEKGYYLHNSRNHTDKCYIYQGQTLSVTAEFDVELETSLSNPNLVEDLKNISDGKAVLINVKNPSVAQGNEESFICKKEIFDAIKGTNKTIIFNHFDFQWVFYGKDIVEKTKDIELSIFVTRHSWEELQGNVHEELHVNFADNGILPGKANVRVRSDIIKTLFDSGNELFLFYINDGVYELQENGNVEVNTFMESYWCCFDVTHNSEYAVSDVMKDISVKKIKITGISKKIAAGKKVKLTANITPINAINQKVTWKSSNKKYATVNSMGVVTTRKNAEGKKVKITAMAKDGSGVKAVYEIRIMKDSVKSVKLKAAKSVKAGNKIKIKATVKTTGKDANKTLKWTIAKTKYATVNNKGVVKTKKAGKGKTIKVTAMATDGTGKKKTIKIRIK